jgi:hypothetical protein
MDVFDARTFDEHKVAGHYAFHLDDGTEVDQWETPGKHYVEERRIAHTNRSVYRMFFFDTKQLMRQGEQFCRFPIGVWRTFDQNGRVTEEINHELQFPVSVEKLEQIMHDTGVEINRRGNGVGVLRETVPMPSYTVVYPDVPGKDSAIRYVVVDAASGKIVSSMVQKRTKD